MNNMRKKVMMRRKQKIGPTKSLVNCLHLRKEGGPLKLLISRMVLWGLRQWFLWLTLQHHKGIIYSVLIGKIQTHQTSQLRKLNHFKGHNNYQRLHEILTTSSLKTMSIPNNVRQLLKTNKLRNPNSRVNKIIPHLLWKCNCGWTRLKSAGNTRVNLSNRQYASLIWTVKRSWLSMHSV